MAVVGFAAKAESNGLFELFHPAVFYGEEDLVRGGVEVEGDPYGGECFIDLFGIEVGGAPHLNIEAILEKIVKLDAEEPAFGEECAMLFDHGEEVQDEVRVRDHDGFAEECAAFRAADIEDVCEASKVFEGDVICGASEGVGEAGSIDEERKMVPAADGRNVCQLFFGIEGAPFGRFGNVDHAWMYHVIPVVVGNEIGDVVIDRFGGQLAFLRGKGKHFVTTPLNGAGFMDIHMAAVGGDDAFIRAEDADAHGGIGLGAADEDFHFCFWCGAGCSDAFAGGVRDVIQSVAGRGLVVCFRKTTENIRMAAFLVVGGEGEGMVYDECFLSLGYVCHKL